MVDIKGKHEDNSRTVYHTVAVIIIIIFLSVIIDYLGLFYVLGVDSSYLNWDFISIVVSNSVVIGVFLVTYFMIDRRNIAKEKHKRAAALIILKNVYLSCKEMADLFDDESCRKAAVRHCDGNKLVSEDAAHSFYRNHPFIDSEQIIAGFMSGGVFSNAEIEKYYAVKRQYQRYISLAITFYDAYENVRKERNKLFEMIDGSLKTIEEELNVNHRKTL